jgi:hypothetical protein
MVQELFCEFFSFAGAGTREMTRIYDRFQMTLPQINGFGGSVGPDLAQVSVPLSMNRPKSRHRSLAWPRRQVCSRSLVNLTSRSCPARLRSSMLTSVRTSGVARCGRVYDQ